MANSILKSSLIAAALMISTTTTLMAATLSERQLDTMVKAAMKTFKIPGIAVGIIKDGKIEHLKGYGVREVGHREPIDANSMFAIASNSKAFTATALAILVDDGVIGWDDKVIDYIPNFRLQDPWITREFTIRDLLTHRSGMGLGAGDLMFWPTTEVTREQIIQNVRHLKMVSGFRAAYAYDNLLYVIAGEVIAAASGMGYEQFIEKRIIAKLGMADGCAADISTLSDDDNIAQPHVMVDGKLQKASRLQNMGEPMVIAAAGGIQCSAASLMKWLDMHLNDGAGLVSKKQHDQMWSPQTIIAVNEHDHQWHGTNFTAYGLGFRLKDYHGYKHVSHTGGLLGMVTYIAMIPQQKLGVVVLTNQENGSAMRAIMKNVMQVYLDSGNVDWTQRLNDIRNQQIANAQSQIEEQNQDADAKSLLPLDDYLGTFKDPWFGKVTISKKNGGLYFSAERSRKLKGPMSAFKFNTFKVIWDDRSFNADAYAMFSTDFEGKVNGLKMKPISSLTDFSYDFQDLNFSKVFEH